MLILKPICRVAAMLELRPGSDFIPWIPRPLPVLAENAHPFESQLCRLVLAEYSCPFASRIITQGCYTGLGKRKALAERSRVELFVMR